MRYTGIVTREGKYWNVEFPDAPGCATFGESEQEMLTMAQDAIEGWLRAWLVTNEAPPKQSRVRPKAAKTIDVYVPLPLATAVIFRRGRMDAGLSQSEVAKRVGVKQPVIAKLEREDANPTIDTIAKMADALDILLDMGTLALSKKKAGRERTHITRKASKAR